ncbi:MAG TPA: hypothetical protein VIC56_05770 [Gemmatimonadota bacterium]
MIARPAAFAALGLLLAAGRASGQERAEPAPDGPAAAIDSAAGGAPEAAAVMDTIVVIENREGLVWGDWYVNPSVGRQIERAFEVEGKLSGRTWLESGAPIQDLGLDGPRGGTQAIRFTDKGTALDFWEPGEVEYAWALEGPWSLRANGVATAEASGAVTIAVPVAPPPDETALEPRRRVGRLDVSYRPRERGARIPRGRFTIFLYYVDPSHGYRIAGVGY